jgi:hypothetical protein
VIGQQQALAAELLDRPPEAAEVAGAVDVGRGLAGLEEYLGEDRSAQTVAAAAKVDMRYSGPKNQPTTCEPSKPNPRAKRIPPPNTNRRLERITDR